MPQPIENNQPILTVKLSNASMHGFHGDDVALHLKVQERGSSQVRTWLGKEDVMLFQKPWTKPRAFTRVRFHLAPDAPVFVNGQREQFTRISIPDYLTWPAEGCHSTHEVAIRPFDGPENGSRIAKMRLNFAWHLTANVGDIITYLCSEMDRHAHSHSLRLLRQLDQAVRESSSLGMRPGSIRPVLIPPARLRILLKNLSRAWFAWLFRPGNAWFYRNFIHDNFGPWSLDAKMGTCYRYDLWPDLLYGFLGHAAGFSTVELLTETGMEDAAGGLHDLGMLAVIEEMAQGKYASALNRLEGNIPLRMQLLSINERIQRGILCGQPTYRDATSVRLGVALWREKGSEISGSERLMLKKLRLYGVPKKFAPEGISPSSRSEKGDLLE